MFCPVFPFANQVLLCKYRIDLLVELQPDFKLAPYSGVLIHDLFEPFGISEDHFGVFIKIIFKVC
jgi:hypothetical protein